MTEAKTAPDPKKSTQLQYTAILGGTNGLGAEIAKVYQSRGEPVIILGRSTKKITMEDPKEVQIRLDLEDVVSSDRAADELKAAVNARRGRLMRFYWTAGMILKGKFEDMSRRDLRRLVDVNQRNALPIVQEAWKLLISKENEGPRSLVVISSTTGLAEKPNADEAVYAMTKAGQVSFARALGQAAASDASPVALFCPGGMSTTFWRNMKSMDLSKFLDPAKVAAAIVEDIEKQEAGYYERTIPRGSL